MIKSNLMPIEIVNSNRTREQHSEDSRRAGIASGEARRKKKAMKEMLEMCLEMKDKKENKTYRELATMGLIKGAINGNAQNYKAILETLGELKEIEEENKNKELSKVEELLAKIEDEASK